MLVLNTDNSPYESASEGGFALQQRQEAAARISYWIYTHPTAACKCLQPLNMFLTTTTIIESKSYT